MYHDAPEVTPNNAPEEYYQAPETCHRPDKPVPSVTQHQPHEDHTPLAPVESRGRSRRKGVLVYSVMATLIAAVIGLAVAAGLGMKRAAAAETRATTAEKRASIAEDQLSTYVTPAGIANDTTSAAPSDASFGVIDRGCSSFPDTVNGSIYTTPVHNKSYRVLCNVDSPNTPLLALLVPDFDHCMYACESYTKYLPDFFPDAEQRNKTCAGVTFVPAWTKWEDLLNTKARGNCYLKQGPMDAATPYKAKAKTRAHSAYAI